MNDFLSRLRIFEDCNDTKSNVEDADQKMGYIVLMPKTFVIVIPAIVPLSSACPCKIFFVCNASFQL